MMAATPSLALDLCKKIHEKYSVNLVESTKFPIINRNQCMILFRKLLDTQETLVTIQHKLSDSEFTSAQSSAVGPVIHGLIHVLKRVHAIFFKDCFCKDKWLETALRQGGDLKETFGEIVSDLQWYRSVLHSIVFKQVGQDSQDFAPVDCDRNLSEIDLQVLSAAGKWDQEDLKCFLRELKGEPSRCGGDGGYISMQCLATQLLDKLEFQPRSSTALEKYDEGLHEGGRNKWSEWPLVLSVNMRDLRKGPLLGEGSFGSVHETDWLGETYAMKIPKHAQCAQWLELEIKALAGLQHPHVIRLVGCAEDEGKQLYLMERMDKSLSKILEDCPLPLVQRVDVMLQIAEGVRYLHSRNIVHRDLKPENILVKRDDSGPESLMLAPPVEHFWIAKVSDFGCAKEKMESMAYAGQTTNVGTTMFMAPEMYGLENGAQHPERFHAMKTDVYSFALICFVVLTSESAPFPFKELMNPTVKAFKDRVRNGKRPELPPNCPVYLSDLIEQCWDDNPVKRPDFDYICAELRRIKDFLLTGEEQDIESLVKKSQMWADGSDSLGTLNFRNSAMESPWIEPSQQRMDSAVASSQNEVHRALVAGALQEIRTGDSKQLHHPLSSPQLHFHQQESQAQQQHDQLSTHRMVDAPGPLLQLSFSGPQSQMNLGCSMRQASNYCESDLEMGLSSFSLQGMLGRAQSSSPISENDQFFNILPTMQNPIPGSDLMVQDRQVSSRWFSTIRTQNQADPGQPMLPTRMGQVDTSPSPRVSGPPFTHPQHSETGVQPGLAELPPLGFRQDDQDADQLQADCSNLLFGQPLIASAPRTCTSKTEEQQNTFPGNNMLPGSFCQPATADIASGVVGSGGLDDNGLYQRNSAAAWPFMQAAPPLRTFIKVCKLGMPVRSLDIRKFHNYVELRSELAGMFNLEGLLDETVKSGWQLVCSDKENDILLVGDDPWEEFVSCVRSIRILSPSEVSQMAEEQCEILNAVPIQVTAAKL